MKRTILVMLCLGLAVLPAVAREGLVVGVDQRTQGRAAHDMPEHGLAVDQGQGLSREAGALVPGGDDGVDVSHVRSGKERDG